MPERHLGRTLGRYRVDALLGTGGFAWVYRGFDPDLEIPVALKVLKPHFAGDPEFEARFRREASTAARLRHPNIVTIYAVGREDDAVYFAMDYLPQGLSSRLEVSNTLPEPVVARIGLEVARALAMAHRAGVVHRDIKADNILFDDHGNAIVVDFGIARAAADAAHETRSNVVVGTPQYFAPEQARGREVDGRTDIYALGVTLFRAATGKLPFEGDDWYAVARQHVEDPPPRPRELNPGISERLEQVLLRSLEKRPEDRFQTADDMATALASLTGGSTDVGGLPTIPMTAVPEPRGRTLPDVMRRRRITLAAMGIGIAALMALVFALRPPPLVPPDVATAGDTVVRHEPLVVPPPDARPDSDQVAAPDPAEPRVASLVVNAPLGARISIDGRQVATGSHTAEGISPGTYTVEARVDAVAGCRWAVAVERVTVNAGRRSQLDLAPQTCGRLRFARIQSGARYRLAGAGVVLEGAVPMDGAIVLPVGRYEMVLTRSGCETYGPEQVDIAQATTARPEHVEYVVLSCGNGSERRGG